MQESNAESFAAVVTARLTYDGIDHRRLAAVLGLPAFAILDWAAGRESPHVAVREVVLSELNRMSASR